MKTINLSKRARALLTLIGSWKIYHVFKMKAHFLLVASLLQFVCWEKLTSRLSGYSKRLTAKIAYFKDIEAALNACVSVRDWETLTESIQIPKVILPMAYTRLTELTLEEIEVSFIFHWLVSAFRSI